MKNILVIGAGRTSSSLIKYLLSKSAESGWFVTVADQSLELAEQKAGDHPRAKAIKFNVMDDDDRGAQIAKADIVVSLLPETHHKHLIKDCIKHRSHIVTASYTSPEMASYDKQIKDVGLIFLNEMGLDPGIDHMDTMRLITKVKTNGGKLISLRSFGGGLVAPESDDNPWGYKITWNPMNVVIAGMASARYVQDGKLRIVPYNRLFLDTHIVDVPGVGKFEAYPNRDSIKYRKIYKVQGIPNVFRGSMRKIGFCKAWNALVQIGLTDNRYIVPDSHKLTYNEWLSFYLQKNNGVDTKQALIAFLTEPNGSEIIDKIEWLGLLSDKKIKLKDATPSEILLDLLKKKWKFKENDRDMVILHTEVKYEIENRVEKIVSSFVVKGEPGFNTAMSSTVGLPMGIAVKLILSNKVKEKGVIIPIYPEIYKPALKELAELGIKPVEKLFIEK
ncbi:MAG TPA: saccharopine dehydrogenase C-terminal domain-containing protein [Ignavibacteriaceae bacterium]|nr:saccharopine dehydrogenase C-terminal domain-containing protein [Ignavibacteriaceae bacterium]